MWKLYMLLNNQWIKKDMKQEIKMYLETSENKTKCYKTYGMRHKQL